jgi:hypothetical protein
MGSGSMLKWCYQNTDQWDTFARVGPHACLHVPSARCILEEHVISLSLCIHLFLDRNTGFIMDEITFSDDPERGYIVNTGWQKCSMLVNY